MRHGIIKFIFLIQLIVLGTTAHAEVEKLDSLVFEETIFDFGDIKQGDVVDHVFTFENRDSIAVIITKVITQCGCTAPEYGKEPIPSGDTGEVLIKFDSKDKFGYQRKTIKVKTSTGEAVKLIIHVNVI